MLQGKVIFLNGVSSSGKSSLAYALQQILEAPYLHANADVIKEMSKGVPLDDRGEAFARGKFMPSLYASIPSCFAAIASLGCNLIIDDMTRPLQLRNYMEALAGHEVWLVGVHCGAEELERRERSRADRVEGRAKEQLAQGLVHALGIYDVEVDTSRQTLEDCALHIKHHLNSACVPKASARLTRIPLETVWNMTDTIDQSIYAAAH